MATASKLKKKPFPRPTTNPCLMLQWRSKTLQKANFIIYAAASNIKNRDCYPELNRNLMLNTGNFKIRLFQERSMSATKTSSAPSCLCCLCSGQDPQQIISADNANTQKAPESPLLVLLLLQPRAELCSQLWIPAFINEANTPSGNSWVNAPANSSIKQW